MAVVNGDAVGNIATQTRGRERQVMNREFRRLCTISATAVLVMLLAACSSGGSLDIGRGQTATGATTDFGIAYIKRVLPSDPVELDKLRQLDDLRHQRTFWSKADVYIRDKASPSGVERNITTRLTGTDFYDIKNLDVSADGTRLVFAMRGPLLVTMKDFEQPTWRIYEYDIPADNLHSLTDDVTASEGQDVSPHYLPSDSTHPFGRILIASTRQRYSKGVLLQEGKSGFEAQTEDRDESAFTLNVLDPTLIGPSAFQQISFNQSHDLDPSVMANGRILYTRWDHAPGGTDAMHLYTMNPDGSDQQLLYGAHSHAVGSPDAAGLPTTVQFVKARQMQSGQVLALIRPADAVSDFGGNLVLLDVVNSVECSQRTLAAGAVAGGSNPCPAQTAATSNDVRTIPGPSPGGRFNSAYPLWDNTNRILVSWSQCRLVDTTGTIVACTAANLAVANPQLAPPLYSAWLFDPADNTLKPVVTPTEGIMLTDLVTLQARTAPAFIAPVGTGSTLAGDGLGIIDIRSVYDWADGKWIGTGAASTASFISTMTTTNADARPARFLRIEKAVSMGDDQLMDGFPDFDRNISLDNSVGYMREILGYVAIEADGSVRVKVPANVAFQISVLDANARRLPSFPQHRAWLQLRPGEVLTCNGCHNARTPTSTTAHGRAGLFAPANSGDASGKTVAQQLYGTATNCAVTTCGAATPSVGVKYVGSGAAGDTSIDLGYNPGLSTPLPTASTCLNNYAGNCRITINYAKSATGAATTSPAHIHPLWALDRGPSTCINCHTSAPQSVQCTPTGTITPITVTYAQTPAGGLDLSDDPGQQATTQLRAYLQLVTNHASTSLTLDAACVPIPTVAQFNASLASGSAAASRFFAVLSGTTTGTVNHVGSMTPAELRLLSEWVDIGAQYYNNPFAAPLN
jgi:hypothetical protein